MVINECQADNIAIAILVIIGVVSLYFIWRMLLNRFKGKDELDGLL
jgi:HAMP domain-containing protein